MPSPHTIDLRDCSTSRQALLARPPRVVHASIWGSALAMGAGLLWASLTDATTVVEGPARVRPAAAPEAGFDEASGERIVALQTALVIHAPMRIGARVSAGDVLARLDTRRIDEQIRATTGEIKAREHELRGVESMIRTHKAVAEAERARLGAQIDRKRREIERTREQRAIEVRKAEADLELARIELRSIESALEQSATSLLELERARAAAARAQATLDEASLAVEAGELEELESRLAEAEATATSERQALCNRARELEAALAGARSRLASLELDREQAEIRAPAGGVLTFAGVARGDRVESGDHLFTLAAGEGLRVDALVSPADIGELRPGQPARVKLDAYEFREHGVVEGRVESVSPEPLTSDGRLAHLVRISLGEARLNAGGEISIRAGLTGSVEIETGRKRVIRTLVAGF